MANFTDCKGPLRHAWDHHDGSGFGPAPFGTPLHMMCMRCGTVRRDLINRFNGELLSRRYYYPEGYRDAQEERPSGDYLRLLALDKNLQAQKRNRRAG